MDTYQDEKLRVGRVIEVDGHEVVVEAEELTLESRDGSICSVEPGGYILIGADNTASVAVVSGIRVGAPKSQGKGSPPPSSDDRKLVYCSLVGFLRNGRTFDRGILRFSTFGAPVYILQERTLRTMFNQEGEEWLPVGERHQRGSGQERVKIDRLFGRHTAVLGTTGSGKSWTVASLLQAAMNRLPHSRILFFDLHDEYRQAFPEGLHAVRVRHVRSDQLQLPYWCLNADEIEALFASSEH